MNSKIATIFGGSGFIGRHLVRRLTEKEYRVIIATRSPYLSGFLKPLGNPGQIELIRTNIHAQESIKNVLKKSDVVINIDSTMGYEALAREIKTITICTRPVSFSKINNKFAWPNKFEDTGPIWSNKLSEIEIDRLLNHISNINQSDWLEYINKIKSNIIEINPGNIKFKELIK